MRSAHASSSALRVFSLAGPSASAAAAASAPAAFFARRSYKSTPALHRGPPSYLQLQGDGSAGGQRGQSWGSHRDPLSSTSMPGRLLPPHLAQQMPESDLLLPPPDALKPLRSHDDPISKGQRRQTRAKAPRVAHKLLNKSDLTAEAMKELVAAGGGGPLKNDLVPRSLLVCPIVPPEAKPGRPILVRDLAQRADVAALLAADTHDLVLVKVGSVLQVPRPPASADELNASQLSILRVTERPAASTAAGAGADRESSKLKTTKAQSALGRVSNLRNDGVPQELLISWVSSENDISHKVAQAESYLTTAYRVKLTFQPKRKGGRRDPVPPLDIQREKLQDVVDKLADVAVRSQDDKFDKQKNVAYLHLEPTQKARAAYRKVAEERDATESSARVEEKRRKEAKIARMAAKEAERDRIKAEHQRFLSSL